MGEITTLIRFYESATKALNAGSLDWHQGAIAEEKALKGKKISKSTSRVLIKYSVGIPESGEALIRKIEHEHTRN